MSNSNPDNIILETTMDAKIASVSKINKMYEGLSYFDQYGGSVLLFIIATIIVFLVWSYSKVIINIQPIKDDWVNQRCNPGVIPFAGVINPPDGVSPIDFTQENFTYCTQNVLKSIAGIAVAPLTYIMHTITVVFEEIAAAFQYIRNLVDSIRKKFAAISEELFGRASNVMFTFFPIIIKIKDAMQKSQAVMATSVYTFLGTYLTLKSIMGAIVQIVVIVLIALAILVVIMWLCLNFFVAIPGTALFAVVAAFLIVILVFCVDVLHIQVPGMPAAPQKPSCFDGETILKMADETTKKMKDIEVGDILKDDGEVTSKMQLSASDVDMYDLFGLTVSGTHKVNYYGNWIYIKDHPDAIKFNKYDEQYIYCLNTESKEIHIDAIDIKSNLIFNDWDEIYDEKTVLNLSSVIGDPYLSRKNIHNKFDVGISGDTKIEMMIGDDMSIQNIEPGMVLKDGNRVYGLVEIKGSDLNQCLFNLGGTQELLILGSENLWKMSESTLDKFYKNPEKTQEKMYHLLTHTGNFYINNVLFNDYNSAIELFLDKL
jgi:hypothetical protein